MLWQLRQISWPEWRHHPWRQLSALLAVVLGVALAFSVHLINHSALSEFSAAVRSVNGQADAELRAQREGFDEALYARAALHPGISLASPVIELQTQAFGAAGQKLPLRLLGLDALVAGALAPNLLPRPAAGAGDQRLALFDPDAVYLNAAARERLFGSTGPAPDGARISLQSGLDTLSLPVRGEVAAGGPPLAVMDIAGVQARFGWLGRLSRIELRLAPGARLDQVLGGLDLPPGVRGAVPEEAAQRVSNVSRAYRVNLTVLALVALFTGAFLVFSILSLSVAKRLPQLALLGVLGLSARERLHLVLAESALLGLLGSVLGLLLGTGLAWLALRLLAGDLGGGYFPGVAPGLHFSLGAALVYGALGTVAAGVGGWLPARMAQDIAPAQALKGLGGGADRAAGRPWLGPVLLLGGSLLAFAPPIAGLPLAAYAAVALLLLGGITCVPAGVAALLRGWPVPTRPLALLAVQRARHHRHTATIAVAGVVASLALSVALTVMVASFREAVTQWLDTVLPADLYARTASGAAGDTAFLPPAFAAAAAALPGVARVETQRVAQVQMDPGRPAVALIARPLADPARALPLVGELQPVPAGQVAVHVSEAMQSLYGARVGSRFALPLPDGRQVMVQVASVWRDYARQSGAVMMDRRDFERLVGDTRVNDLALWLQPGASAASVQAGLRQLAAPPGQPDAALIDFASAGEIRAISLRIFDRSFAVTYWLQAVAVAIGLFGIAASFSAQVLARRKEFGLLAHLGLTRRQVLALVATEGALWTLVGTLLGLLLGLAVSVVLVKVVNPQSFHWSMDLQLPAARLALLAAAVLLAGTLTAWLSARAAAGRDVARAVKEDW